MAKGFWRDKHSAKLIIELACKARTLNDDGSMTMPMSGSFEQWVSALGTAILDKRSTGFKRKQAIRTALRTKQEIDVEQFEKLYRKACSEAKQQEQPFTVFFPVWGRTELLRGRRKIEDVWLNFTPSKASRTYQIAANERSEQRTHKQFADAFRTVFSDVSDNNLVTASVKASAAVEAYELGHDALTTYLGVVCFVDTFGVDWASYSGLRRPIGRVLLQPQSTIHFPNGKLAYQGYFYDHWIPKSFREHSPLGDYAGKVANEADRLLRAAKKSNWVDEVMLAYRKFFAAFSQHDAQQALMLGWQLFEQISGGRHANSDTKIRRAANMFEARDEMILVGNHLRERRNLLAHGEDASIHDDQDVAFQLESFISPLFRMYVTNPYKFERPETLWKFCDVPHDKKKREDQRYLLDIADKFHGDQ